MQRPILFALILALTNVFFPKAAETNALAVVKEFNGPGLDPYTFNRVVWDYTRKAVYLSEPSSHKISRFDLITGGRTGEITYTNLMPLPLIMSADKQQLFVGIIEGADKGFVSIVDAGSFQEQQRFAVTIDPWDIAVTSSGHVALSASSGQWTHIDTYTSSGTLLGSVTGVIREGSLLALHPSGVRLYSSGGQFIQRLDELADGHFGRPGIEYTQSLRQSDGVWISPDGSKIFAGDGAILSSDADPALDLQPLGALPETYIRSIVFDPSHGSFFVIPGTGLVFTHRNLANSIEAGRYALPNNPVSMTAANDELWAVTIKGTNLVFGRYTNPANGFETNTAPVASFSVDSTTLRTTQETVLDAGSSSDDQGVTNLVARWDLNADGQFETDFSTNLVLRTNFNIGGLKTVAVQVRDRFGLINNFTNTFEIVAQTDQGTAPGPNTAFSFPFEVADAAYDVARSQVYVSDKSARRIVVMDLATGQLKREFKMWRTTSTLKMSSDGRRLYAALRAGPNGALGPNQWFIAVFDLESGVKSREFEINIDPTNLAPAGPEGLLINGGDGLQQRLQHYNTSTGQLVSSVVSEAFVTMVYSAKRNSILTLTSFIYARFGLDPSTGAIVAQPDSRTQLEGIYAPITLSEDENHFLSTIGAEVDLTPDGSPAAPVWRLSPHFAADAIFGPSNRGMAIEVVDDQLMFHNLKGQYLFRSMQLPIFYQYGSRVFIGSGTNKIYVLTPSTISRIAIFDDPTVGSENNQSPQIQIGLSPVNLTTRFPVSIDAGNTTDENTPADQIEFRFDVNGDGVFEQDWSRLNTYSYRFIKAGSYTSKIEARDKWMAVSSLTTNLTIALEPDPGDVAPDHTPWRLPFEATEWAFDSTRGKLWLSDYTNKMIARVDLRNGLMDRVWTFPFRPVSLAMTPNASRLFVSLLESEGFPNVADVMEFNVSNGTAGRVLNFPIVPNGEIAATDSYIFVQGGSGPSSGIHCFRLSDGQGVGGASFFRGVNLEVAPSGTKVFGAIYGINSTFTRFNFNPAGSFGSGPEVPLDGNEVFVLPGETNVLAGGGQVYFDRPGTPQDLTTFTNIGITPALDIARLPGKYAVISYNRLAYFDNGTFSPNPLLQLGRGVHGIGVFDTNHFLITVTNGTTAIQRRIMPASSASENVPPTVNWTFPTNGSVFTFPTAVVFATEPEDIDGGIASVEFRENGTLLGTVTNFPFNLNLPAFPAGTHTLSAVAKDNLGATSAVSQVTFRLDKPPTIAWATPAPSNATVIDQGQNVLLEVTASDSDGTIRDVRFYKDSITETNLVGTIPGAPWRFVVTNFSATASYYAQATDNDGISVVTPANLVQLAGPQGDEFYRPFLLTGTNPTARAGTQQATAQLFEKGIILAPSKSLWWNWTPPSAGIYSVTTSGSSFDTMLGVYAGTTVGNLTTIAVNDDDPANAPLSVVKFAAYPNTNYVISVDGYGGDSGLVSLSISFESALFYPPANDNLSGRIRLSGTNVTTQGSNVGATAELGEPRHAGYPAGQSVWWEWAVPTNGIVHISTEGSSFDSVLAVYTIPNSVTFSASNLRPLLANDDSSKGGRFSELNLYATRATNYFIAVSGFQGSTGAISLKLDFSTLSATAPPVNDAFGARLSLAGSELDFDWANVGATAEPNEPLIGANPARSSVWWRWRAPATARAYLQMTGYGISPGAAVFTGTNLAALEPIAATSPITKPGYVAFDAVEGTEYAIAVDSSFQTGVFNFSLSLPGVSPVLRLSITPQDLPSNLITVSEGSGKIILYMSSDLNQWTPVSTNIVIEGQKIPLPESTNANFFVRAVLN